MTAFPTECRGGPDCSISQVIEAPIPFFSLCEHHAFPFYGVAHVGYVAHEQIIGISKMTRLVRVYARRFTVQERVGQQIADHLNEMMQPARRRGASPGSAPVHPDARRARGAVPDVDVVLARELRARPGDASRVPDGRAAIA